MRHWWDLHLREPSFAQITANSYCTPVWFASFARTTKPVQEVRKAPTQDITSFRYCSQGYVLTGLARKDLWERANAFFDRYLKLEQPQK